jgi:diguanylate cyclase (GGDEF)-like protein/PAS domain S-box-containing protein
MWLPTKVALVLERDDERALLRAAVQDCGLEAVDVASPAEAATRGAADCQFRLIVSDRELRELEWAMEDSASAATRGAALAVLVREAEKLDDGDESRAVLEAEHPWILRRPLRRAAVRAQLRQAAEVGRILGERNRALAEELHRTRRILDSMGNGVSVSDATLPDLPLVYVNPAFERMTGYAAAEVCGRNCRFLQGQDSDQPGLAEIREAIRDRRDAHSLLKNYRKDGTPFWNELYMSPVFDLEGRLTHFVGFQNDVTARVESSLRVEHMAHHDSLTGLANRGLLMERLRGALPQAIRNGTAVAVLFFDLNKFKHVNDVYGHAAGDLLLRAVADRLKSCTRQGEIVARIGGDEFVVVLENVGSEAQAVDVMRRLNDRLGQVYDLGGEPYHPSASLGLALFPRDGDTPDALLKAADLNMYVAKSRFHQSEERLQVRVGRRR